MIKVRFLSLDVLDVCEVLGGKLTTKDHIDEWIVEQLPELSFGSMDYPYDLEECYECYFSSQGEGVMALKLLGLLKDLLNDEKRVDVVVSITDEKLEEQYVVGSIDKEVFPNFRYYKDPVGTGAFEVGEPKVCPCCGKESTVYYGSMPYCFEDVEDLCPFCIANGEAAKKYDASFIQDGEWEGEHDPKKDEELFCRTPGYLSWQGEYWLSCCEEYCVYLGTVGTKELRDMGIAETVFAEYEQRNEYGDTEEYLVKDGSLCGYLFQCLHCGKYHLGVDAD